MMSEAEARAAVATLFGVTETEVRVRAVGDLYLGRLALPDPFDGRMVGASVYVVNALDGEVSAYPSLSDELVLQMHYSGNSDFNPFER